MNLAERATELFDESIRIQTSAKQILAGPIAAAARIVVDCLLNGSKILTCGNASAAANSQYFCTQMLNRFEHERPGLPAIALTADVTTITAIADRLAYDQIFAQQVNALGQPGDVLLVVSNCARAQNITRAIDAAHERKLQVLALTGCEGGQIRAHLNPADVELCAPTDSPGHIQELHLLTIHCLCSLIDLQLLGD